MTPVLPEAITIADMRAWHLRPAERPLVGRMCCGREVVVIVLGLDNRMEYGVMCWTCLRCWRTGCVYRVNNDSHSTQQSEAKLITLAQEWDYQRGWYEL
jgi:hypothetical protein